MSQQRKISVSRLSQIPFVIFAKVFALKGAINKESAHFLSSMWSTGSPRLFHVSH